jgi:NitT/TauT family transport system substrate-binding protein
LTGAVLALALAVSGCGTSANGSSASSEHTAGGSSAAIPLKFGDPGVQADSVATWVAEDQGFFKKHGLDVTLETTDSGAQDMKAVLSGSLAGGLVGGTSLTSVARNGKTPYKIVGVPIDTFPYVLAGGEGVTSGADVKGKSVAISKPGSASDTAAKVALKTLNIPIHGITFIQAGGTTQRLAALKSGSVAATTLLTTQLELVGRDVHTLVNLAKKGVEYPNAVFILSKDFLQTYPSGAKKFRAAMTEARNFLKNPKSKSQTISIIADHYRIKTDSKQAKVVYNYVSQNDPLIYPEGLKVTRQAMKRLFKKLDAPKGLKIDELVVPGAIAS